MYMFKDKEKQVLKELALRVAELAARPSEAEKRDLWRRHNGLEATRPLIFCDPENGWREIITEKELLCENELAREWEYGLRREIFWGERMLDDRVVEPYFNVAYKSTGGNDWGLEVLFTGGKDGGAYHWDSPLKSYDNLDKLHAPEIEVDYGETEERLGLAKEIFGGILTVRLKTFWWWTLGMTETLVHLRGLEQIMFDMYDYPDELHRLMSILLKGHMHKLDFLEKNGLLSTNTDSYIGSGGFGYTAELPADAPDGKNVRLADMWGFSESQETVGISPDLFKEFIFPYQLPLLERFGLNCYGCCEPLDKRWHIVRDIPRLRRVSVSPWANLRAMAENLGNRYVYSLKPNPAYLAVPAIDEDGIRKSLREAMEIARSCRLEVIMKDNNTICNNPENVIRWTRIAKEEAGRI